MIEARPPARKTDETQLGAIVSYLRCTHGIPADRIRHDIFVLFSRRSWKVIGMFGRLARNELGGTVTHQPDIVILDEARRRIELIIELDGSAHGSVPQARRRTRMRDEHYSRAGITCCVIDIVGMRSQDASWWDRIDGYVAGLGRRGTRGRGRRGRRR